jgi:hypothetical protein
MDGSGDDWVGWATDGVAAGILGAAAGVSLTLLGEPLAGAAAAAVSGVLALVLLRQVTPEPRRFRLPSFVLETPAIFNVLELTDVVVEEEEPLELVDRLASPEADSRVVQLFGNRPLPTPGELQQRIERHLGQREERGGTVHDLGVDASAALRQALGELRRSLA